MRKSTIEDAFGAGRFMRAGEYRGSQIEAADPFHMARETQRKRAGAAGEIHGAVVWTGRNEMREALGFAGAVGNGKTSEYFRGARETVAN